MEEKRLPPDESANGHDDGPVPATLDERIKLATEKGGLKSCPASFSDEYLDWEIIKSDNPFEVLYLDYRAYDRITRAMIDGNFVIIKKFWTDTAVKAMSSPQVAKKYGGIDPIRRYPQFLQKAYAELTADANALKQCFEQIIQRKQAPLRSFIENTLIQGEYNPLIRKDVTEKGIEAGLTEKEVASLLIGLLNEKSFVPERGNSDDPLSVKWYSLERKEIIEKSKAEGIWKQLESVIHGILSDDVVEPRELESLKEKGKQLGYPEEQLLSYFEKILTERGFSPDPDANIKKTDPINKKMSVIWRTDEKHRDVSISEFRSFLDGKLYNGIYTPDDYVKITEAAKGILRRDAIKLKANLIDYLKEKGFKPAVNIKAGNELTVKWQTNIHQEEDNAKEKKVEKEEKVKEAPVPVHVRFWTFKRIIIAVIVGVIAYAVFIAPDSGTKVKKTPRSQQSSPAPVAAPALAPSRAQIPSINQATVTNTDHPSSDRMKGLSESDIKVFIERFLSAVNNASISSLMDCYADQVDFFNKGIVSKEFIRKDKINYYKRWPRVNSSVQGTILVSKTNDPDIKTVQFDSNFSVSNPARRETISGLAKNTLTIRNFNGHPMIVKEEQTVISREKRYE